MRPSRPRAISALLVGLALAATAVSLAQDKPQPDSKTKAKKGTAAIASSQPVAASLLKALAAKVPPKAFRKGHVTPLNVSNIAPVASGSGFAVQLPAKSPVHSVAIYKDRIYLGGGFNSKTFFCLDASTGKPVWGVNLDDDGPSSPVCADGLVVFNTESCTIFALEAATGKLRWAHWMGDPMMAMPAIADGRVYTSYPCAGNQGTSHVLACLDLQTGKVLWQHWIDSEVMTAPIVAQGQLYVNTFSGHAYVFEPKTGKLTKVTKERATSAPTITAAGVAMTRRTDTQGAAPKEALVFQDHSGVKHQSADRKAPWLDGKVQLASKLGQSAAKQDAGNGFTAGAPATANAIAAFRNVGQNNVSSLQGYQGARLLALRGDFYNCDGDSFTRRDKLGKTLWSFKISGDLKQTGGFLATPPIAAGGYVFTATYQGELLQVDPAKGKVVKRYSVGGNVRFQPVAMGGKIYLTTLQGKLVCIDTKDKAITGWPMWGKNAAHTGVQSEATK